MNAKDKRWCTNFLRTEEAFPKVFIQSKKILPEHSVHYQRIAPKDFGKGMMEGFGFSFSNSALDVDGKAGPDFGVSAVFSSEAAVIYSRPSVRIEEVSTKIM